MMNLPQELQEASNDRALSGDDVTSQFIGALRPRSLNPDGLRISWLDRLSQQFLRPVDPHQPG